MEGWTVEENLVMVVVAVAAAAVTVHIRGCSLIG